MTYSYSPIAVQPTNTVISSGACTSDCCPDTSCNNTGGCGSVPDEFNYSGGWSGSGDGETRSCNDYCASYSDTYGSTAGGCSSGNGCYACEECVNNECKRYEDSCQCAEKAPADCLECSPSGLWVVAHNCGNQAPEEQCVCIREDNYCGFTLTISTDCSNGPPNPDANGSVNSPTGWVLVGTSSFGGVCHWDYCSNGSGAITDNCRNSFTGEKCCPGQTEECNCTHTPPHKGTGETIYGPGRWCTPQVGGVPPPDNYELYFTNEETGEQCFKEVYGIDSDREGVTECVNSCTGEECDCVNCHCHSDCPPNYTCQAGNCVAPTPPPA